MLPFPIAIAATGGGPVLTLSGGTATDSVANGNTARAGFRFNADGTVDKLEGVTYTQIAAATDWRIPNGPGAGYYIRFVTGLNPTPDNGTMDTWLKLSSAREFYYEESTDDTEDGGIITVELSSDGGSTVADSAAYDASAIVGLPP